jgi:ATP-binding cassette, subfamily B, bacterial
MPGVEVVLRYEQILHTLQTALDDGEKKYTAELNATIGRGSKSAGDLIKIIFADFMPALLQVSISVALAATVEPLVGGIMLASGLTSFLVTRTQLRSQDGVRVGIARKKSHLDGSMTELLRGKPIVRTLNAVELEASRVRREATDLSKIERRHHRTMGLFDAGKMTIESIFGVVLSY